MVLSPPAPNQALHLTASSVRSCVAPASGSSSGLALAAIFLHPTHESLRHSIHGV
jgi:hypothetical protein